jgi:hypothetical protein
MECSVIWDRTKRPDPVVLLNSMSDLYHSGCDLEVISLGSALRAIFRDKVYALGREALEFVGTDGSATTYVLRGYERNHLGILMALSFLRLGKTEAAKVELRKVYEDQTAKIENSNQDPVSIAMQAVLWETLGETQFAIVHWKRLSENSQADHDSKDFAGGQLRRLQVKNGGGREKWRIFSAGSFPESEAAIPFSCRSRDVTVFIPVGAWLAEHQGRLDPEKNPLEQAKRISRGAIGTSIKFAGGILGAGVGLGACILAVKVGSGAEKICELGFYSGLLIFGAGKKVETIYTMPNDRRWKALPAGFLFEREIPDRELYCKASMGALRML